MSTKIYNGYKSPLNLEQLLEKFHHLVPKFEKKKNLLYSRKLAWDTVDYIDDMFFRNEGEWTEPNILTLDNMARKHREIISDSIKRGIREPELDFSANVSLLPMKGKTLMLFYAENDDITEMWRGLAFVHDYHYQNQTDRPKGISAASWKNRIDDWDEALQNMPAIRRGYNFTFTTEEQPWMSHLDINRDIPSDDDRAMHICERLFMQRALKDVENEPAMSAHRMSVCWKAIDSFRLEYSETKEFKKEVSEIKSRLTKPVF